MNGKLQEYCRPEYSETDCSAISMYHPDHFQISGNRAVPS